MFDLCTIRWVTRIFRLDTAENGPFKDYLLPHCVLHLASAPLLCFVSPLHPCPTPSRRHSPRRTSQPAALETKLWSLNWRLFAYMALQDRGRSVVDKPTKCLYEKRKRTANWTGPTFYMVRSRSNQIPEHPRTLNILEYSLTWPGLESNKSTNRKTRNMNHWLFLVVVVVYSNRSSDQEYKFTWNCR